mmetsp:Transcript_3054/g.6790  ORF Transcript_3054/g.6790 Transcript_3054/m.6790 type:complete len:188 (+) Transcript_3054:3635-4198(+)
MHTLRRIAITLVGFVILLLVIGPFLPTKRYLSRTIVIQAPVDVIFKEVNSLKRWEHWSPWHALDPAATINYEGIEAGVGCAMSWRSKHPQVGQGRQIIVTSEPKRSIVIDLYFADYQGTVSAGWYFEAQTAGSTRVTWTNDSNNQGGFWSRYIDFFIKSQLGKSYEQGLRNLKKHAESLYGAQQVTN